MSTVSNEILVPVSFGELLDKISILQIKSERIRDAQKRANVLQELQALSAQWQAHPQAALAPGALLAELKQVNEALWDIEDRIRDCERDQDFGAEFVRLARAVYFTNDERARIKRELNLLLGSSLVEEKSYADYAAGSASATPSD